MRHAVHHVVAAGVQVQQLGPVRVGVLSYVAAAGVVVVLPEEVGGALHPQVVVEAAAGEQPHAPGRRAGSGKRNGSFHVKSLLMEKGFNNIALSALNVYRVSYDCNAQHLHSACTCTNVRTLLVFSFVLTLYSKINSE